MKLLHAFIIALIIFGIDIGIILGIEFIVKNCGTLGIWIIGILVLIVITVGVYINL